MSVAALLPGAGLLAVAFLYVRGTSVLWRRGGVDAGVGRLRVASFLTGIAVLAIALVSPLEALAHATFSMHMVQHVLLLLVAPPLLVAGAPLLPCLWALPRGVRRGAGRAWNRGPWPRRAWHALTSPVPVAVFGAVALWVWHLPALYQAALTRPWLHALEHASLLGSAALLWSLVLRPLGRPRVDGGVALLLVFLAKFHSTVLVAMIVFASRPLYPAYAPGTEAAGRTLVEDQHVAALIMGWPMALVYLAATAALFLSWLRAVERRARPGGPVGAPARAPDRDPSEDPALPRRREGVPIVRP